MALTKLQGQLLDTITSLTANNIISSNNITYSGTLTGSVNVVNIGSGQIYKDSSGSVGIGTTSPGYKLTVNGGNGNAIVYAGAANTAALGCIGAIPYVGSISNSSFLLLTNATVQGVLDTAGNFGLGVTPSAWTSATALQVQNTAIEGRVSNPSYGTFSANAFSQAGVWKYISSDYASRYTQYQANHYWFGAGSGTANNTITDFATAKMILDSSGNLGIGTTLTNASKVSIQNTAGNSTIGSSLSLLIGGKSGASVVGERQEIGFRSWYNYNTYTGSMAGMGIITTSISGNELVDLYFYTAATGASLTPVERMRIDSSGNLGLSVTPSGWGSNFKSLQIGSSTGLFNDSSGVGSYLVNNAYYDGSSYKYLNSSYATVYAQFAGQHQWRIASSNTAGSAVTFTSAMTLDNSGNLGIGAASAGTKLSVTSALSQVAAGFYTPCGSAQTTIAQFQNTTNSGYFSVTGSGASSAVPTWVDGSLILEGVPYSTGNTIISSYSGALTFQTSSRTERARIDSNGIFKILYQGSFNRTTPGTGLYGLHFNGQLTADYATGITWSAGGSYADLAQAGIYSQGSGAYGTKMYFATTDSYAAGAKTRMMIDHLGAVTMYGSLSVVSLTETSSIRYKENVNPITNSLNLINQLVGVTYDRKSTKKKEAGLIAEEVDKVIPDIVSRNDDGEPEGIQYTKLTAYLIEAVKELSKEIELLKNK